MATSKPASAPAPTQGSAWSRLVQLTKTASKGARLCEMRPSSRQSTPAHAPPARSSPLPKSQLTPSPTPSSRTRSNSTEQSPKLKLRKAFDDADGTHDSRKKEAATSCPAKRCGGSVEVCPCRVEDLPLPGLKHGNSKHKSDSERVSTSVPRPAHLGTDSAPPQDGTSTLVAKQKAGHAQEADASGPPVEEITAVDGKIEGSGAPLPYSGLPSPGHARTQRQGLQQGDHNTLNRRATKPSPAPQQQVVASSPPAKPVATPLSPQPSVSDHRPSSDDEEGEEAVVVPGPRKKRRLTLYDTTARDGLKRRKAPPKKKSTVQTTLSLTIGGNAGMRECKVCDTVYNPLHPEDVKVHAKMHAGALKRRSDT